MKPFRVLGGLLLLATGFVAGRMVAQEAPKVSRETAAAKATGLPKDISPDQLARVPMVKRDQLSDADKKIFDTFMAADYGKEAGIWASDGLLLNAPNFTQLEYALNDYLHKSPVGGPEYELATLLVAREMNVQPLWTQHEPQALKRGVSKEAMEVIKYRKPVEGLGEREATLIQLGREVFEKDQVTSETFAHAEKLLGTEGLVDFMSIISFRTGGAQLIKAFDQHTNPLLKPLLPIP